MPTPRPPLGSPAVEDFLRRRLDWIMLAFVVVLFAVHLRHAASVYLNPDEALHYWLAHQRSLGEAYLSNNTNAHPPLLVIGLYYWMELGRSEWFLRLFPILFAAGMVWCAYRWGLAVVGRDGAAALAAVLAFLPPVWNLSTEVRHYMPAACFACASLALLESGLAKRDWRRTGGSAVCLWLAILSNYSVLWFAAGYGVYSLWRVSKESLPRLVVAVWAAGQAAAVAICGVLYVTHISVIANTPMSKEARESWLSKYYCQTDTLECLGRNTVGLGEYLFGSPAGALIGGPLVILGAIVIWRRNRPLLLLTGTHLLVCLALAAAGLYPYGGTRHAVLLALPVSVAVAFALSALARQRLQLVCAGTVLVVGACWLLARPDVVVHTEALHSREMAEQSVAYLKEKTPRGGLVFTDHQGMLLLCYYVYRDGYCEYNRDQHFWKVDMEAFRVVSSKIWSLDPDDFVAELQVLKKEYNLGRGAEVWVFDGGWGWRPRRWGISLNRALGRDFGGSVLPGLRKFGEYLGVFRVPN